MSKPLLIIGAGGHGRVVAEAAQLSGVAIVGFIDNQVSRLPYEIDSIKVLGDDSLLLSLESSKFSFTIGVGMSRVPDPRGALFLKMLDLGFTPQSIFHPSAVISPTAEVSSGAQILAQAVVRAGAKIGRGVIVNTSAVIEHDCTIAEFCHVAPCAAVLGGVSIGASSLVGANATVLPNSNVPANHLVKAAELFGNSQ
jgi:UDP-perosamine 4-acetyltransferase